MESHIPLQLGAVFDVTRPPGAGRSRGCRSERVTAHSDKAADVIVSSRFQSVARGLDRDIH